MQRVVAHEYGKVGGAAAGQMENIKVYVRARPPHEPGSEGDFLVIDDDDKRKLTISDPKTAKGVKHSEVSFQFDHIFWTDTVQDTVFTHMVQPQVEHTLEGYNCCCFAYGQTGSGKTYSMFGEDADVRGLIPRSVEHLFSQLEQRTTTKEVAMVCSFLEIYNDQIRDLGKAYLVAMGAEVSKSMALHAKTSDIFESLAGKRGNPYFAPAFHSADVEAAARPGVQRVQDEFNTMNYEIREDAEGNVFVKDLSMVPVNTVEEVLSIIGMGVKVRATHETSMNANSSRSHTVFTITIIQKDRETGDTLTGVLNLVDLAGSERLKKTESQGVRLKEALHINTSLSALGKVIMSLDPSTEQSHVPFRDSKLTRILQNSLGGNSYTTVLAAVHPNPLYYEECLSTLQFANRCRNVRNNPKVNYVSDNEDKDRKIKRLQDEIKELTKRMQNGEGGGGGGGGHHHHQAAPMSVGNVVALLKKLGLSASSSPDGAIVLDGKKMAAADLGLAVDSDSLAEGSTASAAGSGAAAAGGGGFSGGFSGGGGGGKGMNPDKMRRIVAELQESNLKLSNRSKEQKNILDEQGRTIQEQAGELVKYQTQLKHRDWEYQELFQEKERDLKVQETKLREKFNSDTAKVIENSKEVLVQQQSVIASVPETFRSYSTLLKKTDSAREKFDGPIRKEFEAHVRLLEDKRVVELGNIKRQYEHWLKEKDRTLVEFVEKFNKYRVKRSEHLRQCEKEIVTLYEYTEQIEIILDGVEKGKYLVQQKQGKSGRSATGSKMGSRPGTSYEPEEEGTGGVMLPKGLRPTNPLIIPSNNDLELTKRIVGKHKERQMKLEKVKEEAFHKSLHHASLSGTVTAEVDPVLQKQIRDLLVTSGDRASTGSRRPTPKRGTSAVGESKAQSPEVASKPISPRAGGANATSGEDPKLFGAGSMQPASWGAKQPMAGGRDDASGIQTVHTTGSAKDTIMELQMLRAEVAELKAARKIDAINVASLTEEMSSNETVQYVRYLEMEAERLHKQVRDVSNQLHGAKVANSSLIRKLQHS